MNPGRTPALPDTRGDDDGGEAEVQRIYNALLMHPHPTRRALITHGFHPERVDAALVVLEARGLVHPSGGGELEVPPPDLSLHAWATELERQARLSRAGVAEATRLYRNARSEPERESHYAQVRVLRSVNEIGAVSSEIMGMLREQVSVMRTNSPRTRALFGAPRDDHAAPTLSTEGLPVETVAVYDTTVLEIEGAVETLQVRQSAGEDARLTPTLPFSALVVDTSAALIDCSNLDPSGSGSLLVLAPAAVAGFRALVRTFHTIGVPIPSPTERPKLTTLAARDGLILSLLATGASDATIARQAGISQRTVERRVAVLLQTLGAVTRFQAGVEAARRGLI